MISSSVVLSAFLVTQSENGLLKSGSSSRGAAFPAGTQGMRPHRGHKILPPLRSAPRSVPLDNVCARHIDKGWDLRDPVFSKKQRIDHEVHFVSFAPLLKDFAVRLLHDHAGDKLGGGPDGFIPRSSPHHHRDVRVGKSG